MRIKQQWPILVMLAPAIILIFIFQTVPLTGLYMAFTRYKIADGIFGSKFAGLDNFIRFIKRGGDLGYLLQNTLFVNVMTIITAMTASVCFAVFIKEMRFLPYAKIVQTVSFFPYFISWVITYSVVWSLIAVRSGAINEILLDLGWIKKGFNILGDEDYAYGLTIFLNNWKYLGYNSILIISAMNGIAMELYEAAAIDGAGRFKRIWYITLPGITATISILLILHVGNILSSGIDYFYVFQNSTNWRRMEMFDMYVYIRGLQQGDYSYSTAVSIMKSMVSIMLLVSANYTARKLSDTSIF